MLRLILIVATILSLAACAKPLEVGSITEINSKTGSKGVDVLEPKRQAGQAGLPEFSGDQLLEVRAYTQTENSGRVELAGATCTLSAADYSATMETPAKIRVPLYRQQSSSLLVTCSKPGYRQHNITVTAFDFTRQQRMASSTGSGLVGLAVVAVFDAAADNTKNEWRYPLAAVMLEPEAPKSR